MADRLASLLPKLITPNQTGFIKGRSAVTNIHRVLAVLDEIKTRLKRHSNLAILTIDDEKAFDNVSWELLNLVLDHMVLFSSISLLTIL